MTPDNANAVPAYPWVRRITGEEEPSDATLNRPGCAGGYLV